MERTPLLAICAIGAAVEFCWAAGEAVLVPYLARHRVRRWVVSTIYLANPTLGLWVQPRLGAWSDRIDCRVPFVVALSFVALIGIATLVSAVPLARALAGNAVGDDDEGADAVPRAAIAMAFVGFGAADICFDCLLIPGRALLHDLALPSPGGDELFTGFQMGGRLLALLVGSSSWRVGQSVDSHFDACFAASAAVLAGSATAVLFLVDDRGSTYTHLGDLASAQPANQTGLMDDECGGQRNGRPDEHGKMQSTSRPLQTTSNEHNDTPEERVPSPSHCKPDASTLLCTVQAAGWVGICAQSFFWTSWRGEEVGCMDLALQGVVGMATAGLLPFMNALFGAASVWCGSELLFHLLMVSVGLVSSSGYAPRFISALSGINYAVHATNGLIVAKDIISDPSRRARTIAMVNNALPMGQLITALSGGALAQYFGGGFELVFVCYGFLGALLTSAAWIISARRGLFLKNEEPVNI